MNYVNLMCVHRLVQPRAAAADAAGCRNYDTWGASSNPGPNAPLSNACGTSSMPQYSAQAGFNQWTAAKFPAGQILLGLPTYGYVSQSSATKLTGSFALPGPPADAPENAHTERVRAAQATLGAGEGDVSTDEPAPPPGEQLPLNFLNNAHDRSFQRRMHLQRPKNAPTEGAAVGDLSAFFNQQIAFNQIVSGGALVASGGAFVQANGYTQAWDNCSDTPVRRPGVYRSCVRRPLTRSFTVPLQHVAQDGRHVR
jgi:chitinase